MNLVFVLLDGIYLGAGKRGTYSDLQLGQMANFPISPNELLLYYISVFWGEENPAGSFLH
jgi:hypothetical protein